MNVQEVVKEHRENRIKVEPQFMPNQGDGGMVEGIYYNIIFEQVHVNSTPRIKEFDESY
jgi:hypothetical protein